jgi:PAS domain S-box-containing protein
VPTVPSSTLEPDRQAVVTLTALAPFADAVPHGVLVLGSGCTIRLANRLAEAQFGYKPGGLVGLNVEVVLPQTSTEILSQHGRSVLALVGAPAMGPEHDVLARRRDGSTFPVEIGLNAVETVEGQLIVAVVMDLTARREVEAAHRQAIEDRLCFERLLSDVSRQFLNLPGDEVTEAIQASLQQIGESLELDRCTFYRVEPDGMLVDPLSWQRAGVPPLPAPTAAMAQFPWAIAQLRSGRTFSFRSVDEIPEPRDRDGYRDRQIKSALVVPLSVAGEVVGAVGFNMVREERDWTDETVHRLMTIGSAFAGVLARRQSDRALKDALAEVKRLSDQLRAENVYLRREVQERLGTGTLVGQSPAVRHVMDLVHQVARTDSTVLLIGETGTGKELFATQIHELSARRGRAMVRVNCSAIPATLMESELFGREKGAYTGALARQIGRFELADRSSIFLDEIGELPPEVQVKLLRVIEERQIERLGSPTPIRVDTRIIAATHRDLEKRIADGVFRDDLFYRLNVFPIQVPPLRDRVEDIPLLVWRFVEEFSKAFGKRIEAIPRENMAELQRYAWPGNIRELRNVVERAMIVATGPRLTIALPLSASAAGRRTTRLSDVEREHIRAVVESAGWRIRGAGGAADRLGLKPTTLETRMAKLGIVRPKQA